MTHDRQLLSLIRRLRNSVAYAIDLIDGNCDCGMCGPCKKGRSMKCLLEAADIHLKVSKTPGGTDGLHANLSEKQVRQYVQESGMHCPFCGSSSIEGTGNRNVDGDGCTNDVQCLKCGAEWEDIYLLANICVTHTPTKEGK